MSDYNLFCISLHKILYLYPSAVFGMLGNHLVGDPAGIDKIILFKVLKGQCLKIVHIFRFQPGSPVFGRFGLPGFPQVIIEQSKVVVHPRFIGEATGRQLQVDFGFGLIFFLGQQQSQRILMVSKKSLTSRLCVGR